MNAEEVKEYLKRVKEEPELAKKDVDELDEMLLGVIKLEKKHLYGAGTTSANRRREEIEKYLDKELSRLVVGG